MEVGKCVVYKEESSEAVISGKYIPPFRRGVKVQNIFTPPLAMQSIKKKKNGTVDQSVGQKQYFRRIGEIPVRSDAHAYIRQFTSDSVYSVNKGIVMSGFILNGATQAINKLRLSEDSYILQVIYDKKCGGDTQLFVTGSVEKYEELDSSVTVISELVEETRFSPILQSDVRLISSITTGESKVDWYGCSINNMEHIGCIQQRKTENLSYRYKVSCIVYGTEIEMIKTLKSFPASPKKGNDNITGLVAMRISEVRKIIRTISNKKIKKSGKFLWTFK